MPCYHPVSGYRSKELSANGKRPIVFNRKHGFEDLPVTVACGQCVGCRLERSRQWAIRCVHESQMHEQNCFITLTYSDEFLPENGSLQLKHFQDFMKRLRFHVGGGIRFFHCGEYGENFGRPHYHACIFGYDFDDKKLWKVNNGYPLYTSDFLSSLWPFGYSSIGAVTFESAAYVARYIMKKVTGDAADKHYLVFDRGTGEIFGERKPEYITMSRRPGIGKPWFDKFATDVYPDDFVVLNSKKMKPPRYYDGLFEIQAPSDMLRIKTQRVLSSKEHVDNNTSVRLRVRERVKLAQIKSLIRKLL